MGATETPAERLRTARVRAGYETASDAARAFGWKTPTYAAHENGSRGIELTAARRYAAAFRCSQNWLLGQGPDLGPDDITLLEAYRRLPERSRRLVREIIQQLTVAQAGDANA